MAKKRRQKGRTGRSTGRSTGAKAGKTSIDTGAAAEETGAGVRVLPVDVGSNRVEVDAARIEAEMTAAVDAAGDTAQQGTPVAAPADAPVPQESAWEPMCPTVVHVVDAFVVPNWQLKDAEKAALCDALAPVLDDLFPGGLGSSRWAPYFRLAAVCGAIVVTRWNPEEGLPPLQLSDDEREAKVAAADAADKQESEFLSQH